MDDKYSATLVSEHTRWAINRGQHIAYRVDAPAETAASAETVVLQHGYTSSKEDWAGYSAALVAAGYRCISIDSLGHGESASPSKKENYGRLPRAEDIIAVMDAEVRNRFVRSRVPSTILHLVVHLCLFICSFICSVRVSVVLRSGFGLVLDFGTYWYGPGRGQGAYMRL